MKKNLKRKSFFKFGILLIIISVCMITSNQILIIKKTDTENKIVNDIINNNEQSNAHSNNYIAVLEIPKISLRKGLVSLDSINNNVEKNIQVLSSDISNIEKENIVLAAHSGTGYRAFFKNLYKLELGNYAYIYYDNKKFNYIVSDIYMKTKDGNIDIPNAKNLLVLTTCYGRYKQLVIILKQNGYVKTT